jgi:hypothetical protein
MVSLMFHELRAEAKFTKRSLVSLRHELLAAA